MLMPCKALWALCVARLVFMERKMWLDWAVRRRSHEKGADQRTSM